jgi:hypothetical protein
MSFPEAHAFDLETAEAWDRRSGEPTRAYAAFRIFRDLPPSQRNLAKVTEAIGCSERATRGWAASWSWRDRADAWDDACHRIEDRERLEAIRQMHSIHQRAGRAAMSKAIQALSILDPAAMTPGTIARMMELGAKLERSTLLTSVEELQGIETIEESEDPWDRIARELDPANVPEMPDQ